VTKLRDRSTGDILVLLIAGTVCFMVLATGGTIAIVEITSPSSDTTAAIRAVTGIINTLIGLLAGFLAGRTDLSMQTQGRKDEGPAP